MVGRNSLSCGHSCFLEPFTSQEEVGLSSLEGAEKTRLRLLVGFEIVVQRTLCVSGLLGKLPLRYTMFYQAPQQKQQNLTTHPKTGSCRIPAVFIKQSAQNERPYNKTIQNTSKHHFNIETPQNKRVKRKNNRNKKHLDLILLKTPNTRLQENKTETYQEKRRAWLRQIYICCSTQILAGTFWI